MGLGAAVAVSVGVGKDSVRRGVLLVFLGP